MRRLLLLLSAIAMAFTALACDNLQLPPLDDLPIPTPAEDTPIATPDETPDPTRPGDETPDTTRPADETPDTTRPEDSPDPTEPDETPDSTRPDDTPDPTEPDETPDSTRPDETLDSTDPDETPDSTEPDDTPDPTEPDDDGILSVQGALALEDGAIVTVRGVVTSYPMFSGNRGFWIQDQDATALFVFQDFADGHPGLDIGNEVVLEGELTTWTEFGNHTRQLINVTLVSNDEGLHPIHVIDDVSLLTMANDFYQHVSRRVRVHQVELLYVEGSWVYFETGHPTILLRFHTGSYPVTESPGAVFAWIEFTPRDLYQGDIRGETAVFGPLWEEDHDGVLSVKQALNEPDEAIVMVRGVVTSYPFFSGNPGFWIQDDDGTPLFIFEDFGDGHPGVQIGNEVVLSGQMTTWQQFGNHTRQLIDATLISNDEDTHPVVVLDDVTLSTIASDFFTYVSGRYRVHHVELTHYSGDWVYFETGYPDVALRFHTGSYPTQAPAGTVFEWIEFTARDFYFGDIRGETVLYGPTTTSVTEYLDIYLINDLHGMILPESPAYMGMAKIGNFLINKREATPDNTIILAGGDMLQGSALSNYYHGRSTIELMNAMYFDAFAIGNHEFDWGLDMVTRYFIPDDDAYIADFPLLGANVFYKGTTTIPEGIDPYVILERGDLKVGIIGTIGYGLESSIASYRIEDYAFGFPDTIVEHYAYDLRVNHGVDIVILLTHDSGWVNSYVSQLTGDYRVDAIFNGHSHQVYADELNGVPIMQSGAYGAHVGHLRLHLVDGVVVGHTMRNLAANSDALFHNEHPDIADMIDEYMLDAAALFETIIYNPNFVGREALSDWASYVMRVSMGADIGFQRIGGTRQSLSAGDVTLATLYSIFPFDNAICTVWITGAEIKAYAATSYYDAAMSLDLFDDDTLYKVATSDFLCLQHGSTFLDGVDLTLHPVMQRDLFAYELAAQADVYSLFYTTNVVLTDYIPVIKPDDDPPGDQP